MKYLRSKYLSGVLAVVLLVSIALMAFPLAASAASFTSMTLGSNNEVQLTVTGTPTWDWDATNKVISCVYDTADTEATLTFTNTTEDDITLSFSFVLNLSSGYYGTTTAVIPGIETPYAVTGDPEEWECQTIDNLAGSSSCTLASKASVSFKLTSAVDDGAGDILAGISISGINVSAPKTLDLTFQPIEIPYTVSVGDTVVATVDGTAQEIEGSNTVGYTIATTESDYVFAGATCGGKTLYAKNGAVQFDSSGSVTPIFLKQSGTAPFKVGDGSYWTWEAAMTAVSTAADKTVVLQASYTFPSTLVENAVSEEGGIYVYVDSTTGELTYELPAGVTLLLPYSADTSTHTIKSAITDEADYLANANYDYTGNSDGQKTPNSNVTYTMTIPTGATLKVADASASASASCGRIVVGGRVASGNGSTVFNGATYQDHSNLIIEKGGKVRLGNYAVLAVTGYVLGEGEILAEGTGAEIYQPYVVMDFPGAAVSALALRQGYTVQKGNTTKSGEESFSPYIYWGVHNIQPDLTLKYGNMLYGYCTLGDDGKGYHSNAVLVGAEGVKTGLVTLKNNATLYNDFEAITWSGYSYGLLGRNKLRIEGDAFFGSLQLSLDTGTISADIDTATVTVGIGYNFDVTLVSGTHDINYSMMLLPGSSLTVAKDATLNIGTSAAIRFAVWDGLIHRGYRKSVSPDLGLGSKTTSYTVAWGVARYNQVNYPTNTELDNAGLSEDAEFVVDGKLVIGANTSIGGIIQTNGGGTVEVASGATTSVKVQSNVLDCQLILTNFRFMASMSMFDSTAKLNVNGELTDISAGTTYYGAVDSNLSKASFSHAYYSGFSEIKYYSIKLVTYVSAKTEATSSTTPVEYESAETIEGKWVTTRCAASGHDDGNSDHLCDTCGYRGGECTAGTVQTEDTKDADCTAMGCHDEVTYCTVCGEELSRTTVIDPAAHTPGAEATCTTAQTCTKCGEVLTVALGHTPGAEATCTTAQTCTVCGEVLTVALGHTYDAGVVTAPTCTDNGFTTYTCTREGCGYSYTANQVDALGHTEVEDAATPNCFTDGLTAGSHCSVCNEVLVAQNVAPAVGHHTWTEGKCSCGEEFGVLYTNIVVTDGLDLYFYIEQSDLAGLDNEAFYAEITKKYADGRADVIAKVSRSDLTWKTATSEDGTALYGFCFSGIAAKEMTDNVTAVVCYADGTKASSSLTETIANYALRTLNSEAVSSADDSSKNGELRTALVDMLYYGAACQTQFTYNTVNPATASLTDTQKGYATASNVNCESSLSATENSYLTAVSVSAKNKLMYTFYFDFVSANIDPTASGITATITYTDHRGTSHTLSLGEWFTMEYGSTVLYGIDVTGIPLASGRSLITCKLNNGVTITDSIEGYAARTAAGTQISTTMQMLMRFVDSASAYFTTGDVA